MTKAAEISKLVDQKKEVFWKVNDDIWNTPELYFREFESSKTLAKSLSDEGFDVTWGSGGMETAFIATYGSGKPVVGFLGEYDALPSLSQVACLPQREAIVPGGPGHGCGHNALGAGAAAAVVALKDYMQANNVPGTIKFFGCPAEEAGAGKPFMILDGAFDDTDVAITWHPGNVNTVRGGSSLATNSIFFHYHGKSSHAAGAPHLGRSALDACELMNVGVNYLREHVIPEARIHYAYHDVGGNAPNVVQNYALIQYYIRAPKASEVREIAERVCDVARGAALMTGTSLEIQRDGGVCDCRPIDVMCRVLDECYQATGGPEFDEADYQLADKFFATYDDSQKREVLKNAIPAVGVERANEYLTMSLIPDVWPYAPGRGASGASTDVGDVSYVVPTVQLAAACYVNGTAGHTWQSTAVTCTSITHKALTAAAKAMALCGLRFMEDAELVKAARAELEADTGFRYETMLPPGAKPTIR